MCYTGASGANPSARGLLTREGKVFIKPWLKTALKIAAVLALIPALTFAVIFGGGYVYGRIQLSRHQRMAQTCLDNSRYELEKIVHAGKQVSELPAPLESMARDEDA